MGLKQLLSKLGRNKETLTKEELKVTAKYEDMVAEYGQEEADRRILKALS